MVIFIMSIHSYTDENLKMLLLLLSHTRYDEPYKLFVYPFLYVGHALFLILIRMGYSQNNKLIVRMWENQNPCGLPLLCKMDKLLGLHNITNRIMLLPNYISGYISKSNGSRVLERCMPFSTAIGLNSQESGATLVFTDRQMDQRSMPIHAVE